MDPNTKEIRKRVLKKLPIWNEVDQNVGVPLRLLEHDVQTYTENLQSVCDRLDKLPKLVTSGEPIVRACKNHLDKDIVKLYRISENGEVVLENLSALLAREKQEKLVSTTPSCSIELLKIKPKTNEQVFAMIHEGEPWTKCRIKAVFHKSHNNRPLTVFKLNTIQGNRSVSVGKYAIARIQDHGTNLRVPKRVIAGETETDMKSGIIAQEPCDQINNNRYMVMMDDSTCRYFKPNQVYPTLYQSTVPWRDQLQLGVSNNYLLGELNHYFRIFPQRHLMVAQAGNKIELRRNGIFVTAIILKVDCDVIKIVYADKTEEFVHRGCPRLMKRENQLSLFLKNQVNIDKLYGKLVGNMKRYHDTGAIAIGEDYLQFLESFKNKVTVCGVNTARKSTGSRTQPPRIRVKLDEPSVCDDRELLPFLHELMKSPAASHKCSSTCLAREDIRTELDVVDIINEFRDTCDLKVPLKLGWKRIMVKVVARTGRAVNKQFIYEAPCGRVFNSVWNIRRYIQVTKSKFDVDYFTFETQIMLNRQIGERNAYYFDKNIAIDSKTKEPLENKNIRLINPINEERLPLDYEYRNESFPHPMLKARGFSFNHEFKSGCDCEDDCYMRASCACHRLNEQAAGVSAHNRGQIDKKIQYKEKRLYNQISTGIFECNSFCKCSSKCPNRVVQNGIRIRLEVRKTIDKGWGVFVLDDVPKGSFICTYSAELLDDADQYGNSDMYYADLDYLTVVEQQKLDLDSDGERSDEGVEINEEDSVKTVHKTKSNKRPVIQESDSSSSETSVPSPNDYLPNFARYPKRNKAVVGKQNGKKEKQPFKRIHSMLNETQDYTLDARMQGNIGRFFNHSCDPNSMVQNVFIETHDLRFPVVAFFTKRNLRADEEINWHYNYKIDSIEGRQITCNCGAPNCQGRIL